MNCLDLFQMMSPVGGRTLVRTAGAEATIGEATFQFPLREAADVQLIVHINQAVAQASGTCRLRVFSSVAADYSGEVSVFDTADQAASFFSLGRQWVINLARAPGLARMHFRARWTVTTADTTAGLVQLFLRYAQGV